LAVAILKQLWKNEYFQTAIMIILMVTIVFGFWYGSKLVLNTQYPALAVVSTSMLPTLNVGDVIIVQGVSVTQIKASYTTGDIVVFINPYDSDQRIVHRAVKIENTSNGYMITTVGDNVGGQEDQFSPWSASLLVGKVIARIPYVGNFPLFVNALGNFYYFVIVIIIIINLLLSLLFDSDGEKKSAKGESREKRKLFGKLQIETVIFLISEVLLVGFLIFNLFGIFTFWQIGADPPQNVTIRGIYSDLQYQTGYRYISEASLSQGFLTYQIDCLVNGTVRPGVPTFSWVQVSILLLVFFNLWIANKHLQFVKRLKQTLKLNSIYK
jgi:signal peptidase I